MTLLVPNANANSMVGTSSTTIPAAGAAKVDMSLDDLIKSRRQTPKAASRRGSTTPKKASVADRAIGKGKASRAAVANARRGIAPSAKPTAMDIEREVYRQTRKNATMNTSNNSNAPKVSFSTPANKHSARRSRRVADLKVKAKTTTQQKQQTSQKNTPNNTVAPPAWIGGMRRPPSSKVITAAVTAMTDAGFKVPQGMQMVISFAPAPNHDPTVKKQTNNNSNNNANRGKSTATGPRNNNNNPRNNSTRNNNSNNAQNNNNVQSNPRGGGRKKK